MDKKTNKWIIFDVGFRQKSLSSPNIYKKGRIFVCMGRCITGTWIQGLTIARQALFHLSHTSRSIPSGLVILEIGSCFLPKLAWTTILLFYASYCRWDDRQVPPCPAVFCWFGILQTFLSRLAWNCYPPNLSFQSGCNYRHESLGLDWRVVSYFMLHTCPFVSLQGEHTAESTHKVIWGSSLAAFQAKRKDVSGMWRNVPILSLLWVRIWVSSWIGNKRPYLSLCDTQRIAVK
jgi:hypothetical protein